MPSARRAQLAKRLFASRWRCELCRIPPSVTPGICYRVNATSGGVPLVSIHLRGVFALNQQAYEALGEPEAANYSRIAMSGLAASGPQV
jgi:hypothetical protein